MHKVIYMLWKNSCGENFKGLSVKRKIFNILTVKMFCIQKLPICPGSLYLKTTRTIIY